MQTVAAAKQKIDLELDDVPIDDAMRSLAQAAQINLSLDPDVVGTVTVSVRATPWDRVLDSIAREHGLRVTPIDVGSGRTVFRIANASSPPPASTAFTGDPIDVSFRETPIRTVAKEIGELARVSIVVDEDVQVNVTQFARQLPWDFVLDHVLRKYELRAVRHGNAIRITKAN